MSASPPVSVLMTVYNREGMVAEAIRSILAQDFGDFEFVIVDDGSTDRTAEVIRSFADPRIRLASLATNCGIAMGRNLGLGLVRGEFVAVMDSDDLAMPARLRTQYEFFRSHPEIDIAGGNIIKVVGDQRYRQQYAADDATIKARFLALNGSAMIDPTTMMRTRFLREARLLYPMERTDVDHGLWIEALARGARFAVIQECLLEYVRHDTNITHEGAVGYTDHLRDKTPLRARLLGMFFPALQYQEALVIARWMETSRSYSVADVCAAITAIRKALLDMVSYWGESKPVVAQILKQEFTRAVNALTQGAAPPPAQLAPSLAPKTATPAAD